MGPALRSRARVGARVLLASVVALVLVGLTMGPTGEQPGGIVRTTLQGQPARVLIPVGEDPKGLALWFHGQGAGVDAHSTDPFLLALYRDGWAIATSSYHDASWGNSASTEDTRRLQEWAEHEAGVPASLWVAGSMGGAVSLNALNFGVDPPRCWYGVHPAISLHDMGNVPHGPYLIRQAYAGAPPRSRNPVLNLARLPADIRYRVVGSLDDTLVAFDENITPLMQALTARGIDITPRLAVGRHSDPSHFNAADLLAFSKGCLPSAGNVLASK